MVPFGGGGPGPATSIQGLGPDIAQAGQIIAVVLADTFEAAQEGARKVNVRYVSERPSATFAPSCSATAGSKWSSKPSRPDS